MLEIFFFTFYLYFETVFDSAESVSSIFRKHYIKLRFHEDEKPSN